VGLDQPKSIVSRGYGAALALPIWADIMAAAPTRYPAKPLSAPSLRHCDVCAVSNELGYRRMLPSRHRLLHIPFRKHASQITRATFIRGAPSRSEARIDRQPSSSDC
jgi:membrane carboxypeptidase/penicillin-binding protein